MAKQRSEESEIKKLIEGLYKVIQTTSAQSKEQVRINRELLKVMSLLNAGFSQNERDARELIETVRDGLSINDEFAQKWAQERGATKKDLDDIIKKFRELETIEDDIIDQSRDYLDLLHDRYDVFDDTLDISKKLLQNNEQILNVVKKSKEEARRLSGQFEIQSDVIENLVKKKINLGDIFENTFKGGVEVENLIEKIQDDIRSMSANVSGFGFQVDLNFNPLTKQLDNEIKQVQDNINKEKDLRIDGLRDYFNLNKKLQTQMVRQLSAQELGMDLKIDVDTGDIKTLNGIVKQGTEEFRNLVNVLDEFGTSNKIVDRLGHRFEDVIKYINLGVDRTDAQNDAYQKLLDSMGITTQILVNKVDQENQSLKLLELQLLKQREISKQISASIPKLQSAEQVVIRIGNTFDYINAILPVGIGEFLGLARVSNDLIQSHRKGVERFVDEISKGNGSSKAMKSYLETFGPSLKSALNPLTLIVASSLLLLKFTAGLTEKYKDLTQNMKVSLNQAHQLLDVQLDTLTSRRNEFTSLKDIEDIQSKMIGSSGKVFDLTNKDAQELTLHLNEVGKYFGYGNEQAVELHKTFSRLGADDKLSLNLQKNVGYMAEMAGLSPQIVAQDLVESAETVATYFAGMPDKAARAVIQVRRMGLSLQQAGSIAQKMLDLEGFMTDMYELQAMSGRGIDFSEAFDKGLTGDVEGMTESIMKQIGSLDQFNKMDYLTRTKIAKTLGMSNEELTKAVKLNQDMVGLSEEQKKYLNANLDRMGDISSLSQDDIKNRLEQLQSTDRLAIAWDKIKGVLVKSLIPLAEAFADGIDAVMPIIDLIVIGLKGIGKIIGFIAPAVKGLLLPFKMIGEVINLITGGVTDFKGSLQSSLQPLNLIQKVIYGIGAIWGSVFLLKKSPMAFNFIKDSLFGLIKKIPLIGGVVKGLFSKVEQDVSTTTSTVTAQTQVVVDKVSESSTAAIEKVKTAAQQQIQEVKGSASKMNVEVQKSTQQTKQIIEKTSKDTNLGFMNPTKVKSGFKLFGDIASKTLTAFAIHGASSFLFMRKEGEEQTSEMASNMNSMFGMALSGLAPLLMGSLQEGLERTFTKRMEKRIESSMEDPIKKAAKSFTSLDKPATTVFGKIKKLFSKLTITPNILGSIDATAEQVDKVLPKVESVQEVVEKVKNTKTVESVTSNQSPDISKPIKSSSQKVNTGFDTFKNILTSAWKGIKTVLTDIVKFISQSMKDLSSGIGTVIKNILKGIGDGLSSFKTSAIKGAASLVILSGALWISSKAIQNFASTKWEDIAKAGVVLGGLAAVSLLLGNTSPMMIIAAIGLGLLGAALIPTAYALEMFNKVKWSSLAKAGVALVGLGVIGSLLGSTAPMLIIGSVAIAALGASLIPLGYAMEMFNKIEWGSLAKAGVALVGFGVIATGLGVFSPFIIAFAASLAIASGSFMLFGKSLEIVNNSIKNVDLSPLRTITKDLLSLTSIPILKIFALSSAINILGLSLLSLQVTSGIGKFFGGNELQKIADLSDPLLAVSSSLNQINTDLLLLVETSKKLDLDNFAKITKISLESDVQKKIQPQLQSLKSVQTDNSKAKVSPIQTQIVKVQVPNKKSVAQDKLINPKTVTKTNILLNEIKSNSKDIYKEDTISDNKNIELKLDKMIQLLELLVRKDINSYLDNDKVTSKIKANFNKG